ncbi:uncharacterized protein BJ171DRAFT_626419 [Polychytrium aggregatum]|uniref:uncharacterized protein n=1 Tax=Polychytrium aggregatum TaxID=110093 RepID=UPI0022FE5474|nr:uncharacterized protein BJ171DRAFT_626419 [Polychytrium aggregatum]KAI9202708.1 hypothetical protein BJ171DRAFT_626419 [Polychytrium aggregatum]
MSAPATHMPFRPVLVLWSISLILGIAGAWEQIDPALVGVGATFPASLYSTLAQVYSEYDSVWSYTFTGTSSGAGRTALISGAPNLTWAASDTIPPNTSFIGPGGTLGQLVPIPSVIGGIAVVYHLNITNLVLTRQNVADIFTGKIAAWNDSRLVQNNPALASISAPIQTIVRSGSSGTTSNFLCALGSFDPTLNLPSMPTYPLSSWGSASQPFFGTTNTMVSNTIQVSPYTIGYVDYSDASSTLASLGSSQSMYSIARIVNRNGDVVMPSIGAFQTALSIPPAQNLSSVPHFSDDVASIVQSLYIDSSVPGAYPLLAPTYVFLRQDSDIYGVAEPKIRATLRFIFWMIFGGTELLPSPRPTASPSTEAIFTQNQFVHFQDRTLLAFAYDALKLVTHGGVALFDPRSPCNPAFDANGSYVSANSCKHGYCVVDGPFQDASVAQCICDVGFYNNEHTDCSEPAEPFMVLFSGYHAFNCGVIALLLAAGLCNSAILVLLIVWKDKPDIRAISPNCCYIIVVGCLLGQVGALFYSAEPSSMSLRIYMIFENKRMRIFKTPDWKLMLGTAFVVAIELVICTFWVVFEQPKVQVEGSLYILTCSTPSGSTNVPEVLLYVLNGGIMAGCVFAAYLTKNAHRRFQESKAIGLCSYLVLITLLLCLPIAYALTNDPESYALYAIGRATLSCVVIVVSLLVPLVLFSGRLIRTLFNQQSELEPRSQVSSPKATSESDQASQGMAATNLFAFGYDCSLRGFKFGGAWVSSTVLVFTSLDLIEFREPRIDGCVQASFRFSSCQCRPCETTKDPDSEQGATRSIWLRHNKTLFTLEFVSKRSAELFLENYASARSRPSVVLGRLQHDSMMASDDVADMATHKPEETILARFRTDNRPMPGASPTSGLAGIIGSALDS